ncbi:MAG: phenylacetate--CoA ligase family protein, partial [Planctomycetaceae bacterium]|nr:phenylacetate--CoA ligase family protein [Planctomycetaceae bacterium]
SEAEYAAVVWNLYHALNRSQWRTPEEVVATQLESARALITHCVQHVPYYRRTLREAGVAAGELLSMSAFRGLPIVAREDMRRNETETEAEQLPENTIPSDQSRTSGSSGFPIRVLRTNVMRLLWLALLLRDTEWSGIDPRGPLASIRNRGTEPPGRSFTTWGTALSRIIETGPSHQIHIRTPAREQLEWLTAVQPHYLLSYPANLDALAELIRQSGESPIQLRCIQSISETLEPQVQRRIEDAFGVPTRNTYSCEEAGYLASPCPVTSNLHVHAENVILEILDDADQPCRPGEEGRVILTSLRNFRSPFVRYDIGDRAVLGPAQCPCGRGLPTLSRVLGKSRPLFVLPDGSRRHTGGIATKMGSLPAVFQYQVVQTTPQHVLVRIVPDRGWLRDYETSVEKIIRDQLAMEVGVTVELVRQLTGSSSGKLACVVCEVDRPS